MKYPAFKGLLEDLHLSAEEACYIGDDWNDLQCMEMAGLSMCPADACEEVKKSSDYISLYGGGHGAVRDCLCRLLSETGRWEKGCKKLYND